MKREGDIINKPLTPNEAVSAVFRKIDLLLDVGICESCALTLVAREFKLDHDRLLALWEGRHDE